MLNLEKAEFPYSNDFTVFTPKMYSVHNRDAQSFEECSRNTNIAVDYLA